MENTCSNFHPTSLHAFAVSVSLCPRLPSLFYLPFSGNCQYCTTWFWKFGKINERAQSSKMNVWNWNAVHLKMKKNVIAGKFGIHEKSGQCVKCQFEHTRHLSKSLVYSGGYYASLFARVRTYTRFEPENCSLGANLQLGELLETRPKGERKSCKIEENMENVERDQILRRKANDD